MKNTKIVSRFNFRIVEKDKHDFEEDYMKKTSDLMWSISLIVIGVATLILAGANIIGIELPDNIVRILGIVDLVALPVLAYSTIKKVKKR